MQRAHGAQAGRRTVSGQDCILSAMFHERESEFTLRRRHKLLVAAWLGHCHWKVELLFDPYEG